MTLLIYRGHGAFLPGIPARDLTLGDLRRLSRDSDVLRARLINSGLYAPVKKKDVTRV